ncbi:flavodoxin family protein [Cysteiniphilum sp. QT6929]|uniref:flavodoxin family protein n=1 Tax=Cysteiniphilum sp. QT6929 TaxID=2975055 RepID=UPI0024B3853F|nr:flavodoxin family protein [Cysteiniphilum sp. QT6929]WHN65920.1 flavodoxin family protein [Cysteiniphilum sp. QT6929]
MKIKIAIVYNSSYGTTKLMAEAVKKGVLKHTNHVDTIFADENTDVEVLDQYDGILFGTPTYMGSVSGGFKQFMDKSSSRWAVGAWKDKFAGGFTSSNSTNGDKLNTLMTLFIFACQHKMNWISLGIANQSSESQYNQGDVDCVNRFGSNIGAMAQSEQCRIDNSGDLRTAELYGERFAMFILQTSTTSICTFEQER